MPERRVLIAILLALALGVAVRFWRRQGAGHLSEKVVSWQQSAEALGGGEFKFWLSWGKAW